MYANRPRVIYDEQLAGSRTPARSVEPNLEKVEIVSRQPIWDDYGPERPAIVDSRGRSRFLCACCGNPSSDDDNVGLSCVICDYDEPFAEDPSYVLTPGELARRGAAARGTYELHGSVISPEERAEYGGQLSVEEQSYRAELRKEFEQLMARSQPDASERWERVDILIVKLREAERQRVESLQSDTGDIPG